ncbi:MAG: glycerol-3-phosphate dehydrogenase [Selenomonadaceae bacterium]|nr:glycerol-3-phosphate dehydrogenase [Selenomonadaceae bacterium]
MKISVIGCGRWGSFHAWYASKIGHSVTLYGRENSANMRQLETSGGNDYLTLPKEVKLTKNLSDAINFADLIIISVGSQNLRGLLKEIKSLQNIDLSRKKFVLAMKGLESGTGKRLSVIFDEEMNFHFVPDDKPLEHSEITNEKIDSMTAISSDKNFQSNEIDGMTSLKGEHENSATIFSAVQKISSNVKVAVWVGPGHVQDFINDIPNCMIMASENEDFTREVVEIFKSPLIRFYYGKDLIGVEIGAAAKNVIGLAAGMLDGLNCSSLKGALMARGTAELSRLVESLGGEKMTVYGLSHLGDYQATLFSEHSRNRKFGESFVTNKNFDKLAEGVETTAALMELAKITGVELPICRAVYKIIFEKQDPEYQLMNLFLRSTKSE